MHSVIRSWDSEQNRLVEDEDGTRMLVIGMHWVPRSTYRQAIEDGIQAVLCDSCGWLSVEEFAELRQERSDGFYDVADLYWHPCDHLGPEPSCVDLETSAAPATTTTDDSGFVNLEQFPGYSVNDRGDVRGPSRKILQHREVNGGYHQVVLYLDGERHEVYIHHLVLEAFVGPRPEGLEACHGDDNPANNAASNLRWDTHASNVNDRVEARTHCDRGHLLADSAAWVSNGEGKKYRSCNKCRREKYEEKNKFVNLHTHCEHSPLDGFGTLEEIAKVVVADGQPALAITDHGTCAAHPDLQKVADRHGFKPIFGLEAYFVPDRFSRENYYEYQHLCLYALDDEGLRNLWAMSTESYRDGLYGKYPRLDWDTLERLNAGVACSTGCLRGPVLDALLGREAKYNKEGVETAPAIAPDPDLALSNLSRLHAIFGDRLYVELHTNSLERQVEGNCWLAKTATEQSLPMVAVADAHYACPEDKGAHATWLAIQLHDEVGGDSGMFDDDHADYHVHTAEEARLALEYLGPDVAAEAVAETVRFARRCTARVQSRPTTPTFSKATQEWPDRVAHDVDRLLVMCEKNWEWRLAGKPNPESEYLARFEEEFELLVEKAFCGYFLMVADQVNYAKDNGILVGPGRGSGGGSLIAYLMGITEIDPVEHDLLFARFLTKGRKGLPDFDIDYPSRKKQFMLDYVAERWGADRVVTVGSHLRLRNKGAIRDTAQAMRESLPEDYYRDINKVSEIITEAEAHSAGLGIPWDELWDIHGEELEPYRARFPQLFAMATRLHGRLRAYGKHAAGVIIDPDHSLEGALPLRAGEDGGQLVTQFDYRVLEELGFVKFDFLNITTLDALQKAAELVLRDTGRWIDFRTWRDEYYDPEVFENISEGWTAGIFQIETHSGTRMCKQFQPTSVKELADVITLVRPGPKNSGLTEEYLLRRNGVHEVTYDDPRLEAVLAKTYGLMIYQEDIMATCMVLAGYTSDEADEVRKILGKKQVEKVAVAGQKFVSRAIANGTDPEVAKALWAKMAEFAKYSFNRAHAFAYAVLAVWSGWTKCHFSVQMMCSLLTEFDQKRIPEFVDESRRLGVQVLPPDINISKLGFISDRHSVRYGFDSIHGIGEVSGQAVIDTQPYASYADFIERRSTKCNRGDITKLIRVGAFDTLGEHRRYLESLMAAESAPSSSRCTWLTPTITTRWEHPDGPVELPCGYDWAHEPPEYGRPSKKALEADPNAVGKPLKPKPVPKKCSKACRRFTPAPLPTPEDVAPYTDGDVAAIELEMLGLRLSTSEFDRIPPDVLAELATARDVHTGPPGDYSVAAYVTYRPKNGGDRHGRPMGWLSLSTQQGSLSAVVFASKVEALGDALSHKGLAFVLVHKPPGDMGPQLVDLVPAN